MRKEESEAMQNYLFVHFRETTTPDGEQVYFSLSRDAFTWESLNGGRPVLWAYYGDHGVRDMTVVRDVERGRFHIFATDLSLAYGMRGRYAHSWKKITTEGSKSLAHWCSEDLVHWTEEELLPIGDASFGCVWAPDVLRDSRSGEYILHWSSPCPEREGQPMGIWYSRTADFETWTKPELLYSREGAGVIDSAMYEEDGRFYLFVKSDRNPERVILLSADRPTGPFTRVEAFDDAMRNVAEGMYEAPTAVRLEDGRWCLFLDFFGAKASGQGYVPFVASSLARADFVRSDRAFSFPFGFKHGTILPISGEEYERMKERDWTDIPDGR